MWPDLRAERQGRGLVPAPLLHAGLLKRRKAKRRGSRRNLSTMTPFGSPECWRPLPKVLREASPQEIAAAENEEAEETQEPGVRALEVTAARALITDAARRGRTGRSRMGGSLLGVAQ